METLPKQHTEIGGAELEARLTAERLRFALLNTLELADHLNHTLAAANSTDPLFHELQAIQRHLFELLRREGVQPIVVQIGAPPDPVRHEVVGEHASFLPDHTVIALEREGYTYNGQILRRARVSVAHQTVSH